MLDVAARKRPKPAAAAALGGAFKVPTMPGGAGTGKGKERAAGGVDEHEDVFTAGDVEQENKAVRALLSLRPSLL